MERTQANTLGVDDVALRRSVSLGELERMQAGVYRLAGSPRTHHQDLLAACLAGGDGTVLSHPSAARRWEMLKGGKEVEVTVTRGRQPRIKGAIVHRSGDLQLDHVTSRDEVPVTTPARTLIDQNSLVALGWMVLRFTWEQVVRQPADVLRHLRSVLGA